MAEGGFAVTFDGKKTRRCYAVYFDYDKDEVTFNHRDAERLPKGVKTITVKIEK